MSVCRRIPILFLLCGFILPAWALPWIPPLLEAPPSSPPLPANCAPLVCRPPAEQQQQQCQCHRLNGTSQLKCSKDRLRLSADLQSLILDGHNWRRSQIALGMRADRHSASGMMRLRWDEGLARLADCWAVEGTCHLVHDACQPSQNAYTGLATLANGSAKEIASVALVIRRGVATWFDEHTERFQAANWPSTTHLGCGLVVKNSKGVALKGVARKKVVQKGVVQIFCNYRIARENGSREGGVACTDCPEGSTCDEEYRGLCSQQDLEGGGAER